MALKQVKIGVKPSPQHKTIHELLKLRVVSKRFMADYQIFLGGFDLLLDITYHWVIEGKPSNVYELTKRNYSINNRTTLAVNKLIKKGLIDVVGRGKFSCRLFAPTEKALREFKQFDCL